MTTATTAHRLLVIDDTPSIHEDFRKILCASVPTSTPLQDLASAVFGRTDTPEAPRFSIDSALQGKDGVALLSAAVASGQPYSVAFVDMRMPPGWDGLETIVRLWAVDPMLQVVICTAHSDHSWASITERLGQSDKLLILKKPFDHIEALQLAHSLSSKWDSNRRFQEQVSSLDQTVTRRTKELLAAEERFSQAFNASPIALAIEALDEGTLLEVNSTFSRIFELGRGAVFSRHLEKHARQLDAEQWAARLGALARGEGLDEIPFEYLPTSGVTHHLRISCRAVKITDRACAIWVIRDITDQIQLEQKFQHAQKMEAVGQLAAGVAHDFNNLLTIILGNANLVLNKKGLDEGTRKEIEQIQTSGQRAASLTRQLLVFSRRQITQPTRIDLSQAVKQFSKMLTRLVPERIQLTFDCPAGLPTIIADTANIEHAIMNLVVNASDALPESGQIKIKTALVSVDAAAAVRHPDARPGNFVCLSVIDDGTGIAPDILNRIFDPYFTTKPTGKGTGLGLSSVYGITRQHEGWIEVTSSLGRGTTFDLYFPPVEYDSIALPPQANDQLGKNIHGKGKRVLIVEDDPGVRGLATAFAIRGGYDAIAAEDGPTALAVWRAKTSPFDLLFTDVVMPNGRSGIQLAEQLRQSDPRLKIIFTTGYSNALLSSHAGSIGDIPILLKPYSSSELLEAFQRALGLTAT